MADDPGKELPGSNTNEQPDPPTEIIPVEETKIITPSQQTENMEVHHPHHLTHKKKWGEYLLEFLMLFLAVFLGFVAENVRENAVERHREKEYVYSLREDMAKDTANLNSLISMMAKYSAAGDSLVTMIEEDKIRSDEEIKKLYQHNITALTGFPLSLTDRTEAQLKNSGGMRLIINKTVSDAIVDYWKGGEDLKILFHSIADLRSKARERSYLIFNNKYYGKTVTAYGAILDGAKLMTSEQTLLSEYSNRVAHIKNFIMFYIYHLKIQKVKADSLMKIIDEEY